MNAHRINSFLLLAAISFTSASATTLSDFTQYNLFTLQNFTQTGGDVEGRVAVGGSANITGDMINANSVSGPYAMIVGKNFTASNGSMKGNLAYGGTQNVAGNFTISGTKTQISPLDFDAAAVWLKAQSTYWNNSFSNSYLGSVTYFNWGGVTLAGSRFDTNVFNVDGSKVTNQLTITAPVGSTVIVNVSGTAVSWNNFGMSVSDRTRLLFNFYEATSLSFSGISTQGTIFAPNAALTLQNGNMEGSVIVNSAVTQNGAEFHNVGFSGTLPTTSPVTPTPEPGTLAVVGVSLLAVGLVNRRRRA